MEAAGVPLLPVRKFYYFGGTGNCLVFRAIPMKKLLIQIFAVCVCAFVFSGCVGMNAGGKNPWAPPERKKPLAERWDEAEKKADAEKKAAAERVPADEARPAPAVAVAESHEVAEVVFSEEKMAVAYRLGGIRVPVKKGEVFALRGKDLALSGVARLDVIDGDTLGFAVIAGTANIGDLVTIPGTKLREEMQAKFPGSVPPEPAEK